MVSHPRCDLEWQNYFDGWPSHPWNKWGQLATQMIQINSKDCKIMRELANNGTGNIRLAIFTIYLITTWRKPNPYWIPVVKENTQETKHSTWLKWVKWQTWYPPIPQIINKFEWITKCKLLSVFSIKQHYPNNVAKYKITDKYGPQLSRW